MYFPSYRRLALEWVVTLAEAKPTLARKVTVTGLGGNNTATRTTPLPRCAMEVCFQMMLDIPDEVQLYSAPSGAAGRQFGVGTGWRPDTSVSAPTAAR